MAVCYCTFQELQHQFLKQKKKEDVTAELLFVQMQARAASWRLSEGKQVLAAKCGFSEQRNDCYVLAAVITGTLPRTRLPLQQPVLLL